MLIAAYLRTIYIPSRIQLAEQYEKKLYSVAGKFSDFLGRPARLADLTTLSLCDFLTQYRKLWTPRATNNQRQALLSIWQDAASRAEFLPMLAASPDRKRIRKLPEEIDPPEAWDEDQVNRLMESAYNQPGSIGEIPAGDWWLSLTLAIFETSCRISSMLAVPSAAYDGLGLLVRKQKNHRPQWYRLSDATVETIERIRPTARKQMWEHPWHPRTVWTKFRQIVEAAGLPAPTTGRQLFHRLRRTTITMCAAIDPAIAQRTAGHKDYATTIKHYIDPRLVSTRCAADVLPDPLARLRAGQSQENQSPVDRRPSHNDRTQARWPMGQNPALPPLYESKTPTFRIFG